MPVFLFRDTHKSSTAVGWLFSLHVTYLGEKHNFVSFAFFPRWVAVDLSVFCRVGLEACLKVWLMSGTNATRTSTVVGNFDVRTLGDAVRV